MQKQFTAMLRQQSNSLIITIPKELVKVLKLKANKYVDLTITNGTLEDGSKGIDKDKGG